MALTIADILALARQHYADVSTVNPGMSDAELTKLVNEAYYKWCEVVEPRYSRLSHTVSGLNFPAASPATVAVTATPTNIAEVAQVECYPAISGTGSVYSPPMEIISFADWLALYAENSTASASMPTKVAFRRLQTDTEADINKLQFYTYPPCSADFTLIPTVRLVPAALDSGTASGQPDVSEEARYTIARIVAVHAAHQIGEDAEFIANIASSIPEAVRQSMGIADLLKRPRIKPGERQV